LARLNTLCAILNQVDGKMTKNTSHNPSFDRRLGWRVPEWKQLTGTSNQTFWRQVKRGDLKVVYVGHTPLVPRAEAVRLGFINE
jgi:hypothetical protein